MAAKAPRPIDAIDTKVRICRQSLVMPGKAVRATRTITAIAATFGAVAKKVVTGVGAPSYTSGVHIWNGTAEILKARPTATRTIPMIKPAEGLVPPRNSPASAAKLVVPEKP